MQQVEEEARRSWREALVLYTHPRILTITALGFASGLPLLLVFSTLSFWLKDEGVSKTAIGAFALVQLPYSFKFAWAPLVDRLSIPFLTLRLGRRRAWALVSQVALIGAIVGMAQTRPAAAPLATAFWAVWVAFWSATQDVVIDAFRVESLEERQQGAGAGAIVLGYRVGMLASGAGAIWLATALPWSQVYLAMAALVGVGMVVILLSPEPARAPSTVAVARAAGLGAWVREAVVAPLADFLQRPQAIAILAFILFYKLGDAYLGVMANPFYVETGFSKESIAWVSKVFGLGATIVGGLLGGALVFRIGIFRSLLLCGVLQMLSNLVFAVQAIVGPLVPMLMVTIAVENVTGAMATAAFVAYLSSLCNVAYTATQYALLTSLMALPRSLLSASSGAVAEALGWVSFFVVTTVGALPGLLLLLWLRRSFSPVLAAKKGP